jgi:hypothetical protein
MKLRTMALEVGTLGVNSNPQEYTAGWYVDPNTGQQVYYDPATRNFYTQAGGIYVPMSYMNTAPKQVTVAPGDNLKITVSFKYTGPAITGACIRYCVGVYGTFGFTEDLVAIESFNIPQVVTPPSVANVSNSHTFAIPTNIGSDWNDIYVKMYGGTPSLGSDVVPSYIFGYENALIIVGTQPNITEFKIADFAKA